MHGAWMHLAVKRHSSMRRTSVVVSREGGRAHGAYSDVSAVSAEMIEGTPPTTPEPEKSLQAEPSNRMPSE
jgi:hypothetical protein